MRPCAFEKGSELILLHLLPLATSLGPAAVGVAKRRPWSAAAGLLMFDIGYTAILMHEDDGANSPWHLGWLGGMAILSLSLIRLPAAGSWWACRFGSTTRGPAVWAASPVTGFVLTFALAAVFPALERLASPLVLLTLLAVALLGPLLGAITGWITRSRRWQSYSVMGGAIGLVLASVAVAYRTGGFVFGF